MDDIHDIAAFCELPTAKASWLPGSSSIAIRRWSYRLSPGVTFHGSRGRLLQNIDGRIDIPIMNCTAHQTLPDAYIQRHCFHLRTTNRAGLRRRIPTADLFYPAAIPLSLVPQHRHECRPACISDRLCQMMIRQHTPHVQVFQPDELVFVGEHSTELMLKVAALVRNLLIQTSQP